MYNRFKKYIPLIILIPLSIILFSYGLKNEKDPYWIELDDLLTKDYVTLANSPDSIRELINEFHNRPIPVNDSLLNQLIAKPFMPTMEFGKLKEYLNVFKNKRSCMFSAVTGSGNTTLVDRIANIIALKPENKKVVLCAPQFDLKYNEKYIGTFEENRFKKGELLEFWDKCREKPNEKFVCVFDNIDKLNPETLFGPDLWRQLDDPNGRAVFGKDTIYIPSNFYLICIVQSGVGQKIELTNEHFRRLGGMMLLPVHPNELILLLRGKRIEIEQDLAKKKQLLAAIPSSEPLKKDITSLEEQLVALRDTQHIKKFIYFFKQSNETISDMYSYGHQLGQWSDIRKNFLPQNFSNVKKLFVQHVNAYRPIRQLTEKDFNKIEYACNNDGSIPETSIIAKATNKMTELGFASELGVAGSFALISGIIGWFYFRRRHRYIKEYTSKVYDLMEEYETHKKPYGDILQRLNQTKREFDTLVLDQKVNFNEASFFYGFLEDKTRYIELAREVNESFLKLMDAFLDDDILTDSEYAKLNQFLQSIRYRISEHQYLMYKEEIEVSYKKYGSKSFS